MRPTFFCVIDDFGLVVIEQEWRFLAIDLEEGWEHYDRHDPEPRTLMFRKRKPYI